MCCCSHDAASNHALTSSTASVQFHSCGEEGILIGSFFAISPETFQLGAQHIALGGEGWGDRKVGSITSSSLVRSEQLVAVSCGVLRRGRCCAVCMLDPGNVQCFVKQIPYYFCCCCCYPGNHGAETASCGGNQFLKSGNMPMLSQWQHLLKLQYGAFWH